MTELGVINGLDWQLFSRRFWNQRPVLIRQPQVVPFVEHEVFKSAAAAGASGSPSQPPSPVRFIVERRHQLQFDEFLPEHTDIGFDGYCARLVHQLGGERYALIINGLHCYSWDFWRRERAFFAPLWGCVGRPLTGAITTLFHGNYEHSPVGVHKDRFSTFMFALRGRKRMRFWPERPWREPVSTVLDYQPYIGASFVADVEPGDLLYWPSTYYHVGENISDAAATSVNVGVPISEHRAQYDVDALLVDFDDPADFDFRGAHPGRGLPAVHSPLSVRHAQRDAWLTCALPPALEGALRALHARTRPKPLHDRLIQISLKRWTTGGFEPTPARSSWRKLTDEMYVSGDPAFPVQWSPASRGCYCAAGGHVFHTAVQAARLRQLIARLNTGKPAKVSDLLRGLRRGARSRKGQPLAANREGMRRLLEDLESCGGLQRASGNG